MSDIRLDTILLNAISHSELHYMFCILVDDSNRKEVLSAEIECAASRNGDTDSFRLKLQAIRANGICTMEMVRSVLVKVSKLSSEVQQLRMDNDALKRPLRDIQQAPSHVLSVQREAVSSAIANNATAKSYRNVVCAVRCDTGSTTVAAPARNILPESSIVTGE
jgi:hypothetical protein